MYDSFQDSDGNARSLTGAEIDRFVNDGYLKLEAAFPRELADQGRAILWRDLGCDENDPTTWTSPVIRLGMYGQEPFKLAANTPVLRQAFNQLVGPGRWLARGTLGTFPVRFPHPADAGDTGWHVDTSFAPQGENSNDFLDWRVNVSSNGRVLLMLFLFSDIDEIDAPTRIRVGSHLDIARRLAPAGEAGMSLRELAATGFEETSTRPEALATGRAGTVYLCHPFLVHAAQRHRGTHPRFVAQPPLLPSEPLSLNRVDGEYSPVERAIKMALT